LKKNYAISLVTFENPEYQNARVFSLPPPLLKKNYAISLVTFENPEYQNARVFFKNVAGHSISRNVILREALTMFPMHRIVTLVFIKIAFCIQ